MPNANGVMETRPARAPVASFPSNRAHHAQLVRLFVAAALNVPAGALLSATRGSSAISHARQIAMYLTHVVFSMTLTDVGAAFGRDRSTASHACRLVEWQRDNASFDRFLSHLEQHLRAASREDA